MTGVFFGAGKTVLGTHRARQWFTPLQVCVSYFKKKTTRNDSKVIKPVVICTGPL